MEIQKLKALTNKRFELMPLVVKQVQDMANTFNEVVKAHLMTELFLEELIKVACPQVYDAVKSIKLTYRQKLDFVSKLELTEGYPLLDEHTIGSLRKLNKMRNDFSHRLGHSVTDEEIEALYGGHISGAKELYVGQLPESTQNVAIGQYLFYLFGNMFPKYEFERGA